MKILTRFVLFAVLVFVLVGCQSLLDTGKAASNAAIVDKVISSGDAEKAVNTVQLNDFEKMILVHALNKYNEFVSKYKPGKNMLDTNSPDFDVFKTDYFILKNEYILVQDIVQKHWPEYSQTTQIVLKNYEDRAIALDESVMKLIDMGEKHKSLLDAFEFAKILGGIAAKAI